MNGRLSKMIRLLTIGSHSHVVAERTGRKYEKSVEIRKGREREINIICDLDRRTYQQAKEALKHGEKPWSEKVHSIRKLAGIYRKGRAYTKESDYTLFSGVQTIPPDII